MKPALILRITFLCAFLYSAEAQRLAPLTIDDALAMRSFPATAQTQVVAISPDGRHVAFVTQDSRRSRGRRVDESAVFTATGAPTVVSGCDIQITDTQTGTTKNLTQGKGSNWGPVWAPDGKRLAFYSDRTGRQTLWMWERATSLLRQVSPVIVRPRYGWELLRWSPDSRTLLVKALSEGIPLRSAVVTSGAKANPTTGVTATIYRTTPEAQQTGLQPDQFAQTDLALIEISSGRVERIARGYRPCWYDFAPGKARVAFATTTVSTGKMVHELLLVDLPNHRVKTLATELQLGFPAVSVSWSPDGQALSYISPDSAGQPRLFVVATDNGQARQLTAAGQLTFTAGLRAPVWDQSSAFVYAIASGEALSGDSLWKLPTNGDTAVRLLSLPQRMFTGLLRHERTLLLRTFHYATKQTGFVRLDLAMGRHTSLGESDVSYSSQGLLAWAALFMSFSADGQRLVFTAESSSVSPNVWLLEARTGTTRQLTRLNPQLEQYAFGASRQIEYVSDDGEALKGALLLPAGYQPGRRYPLVVWAMESVRGSNNLNRFGLVGYGVDNLQLLATRGYAALFPDSMGKAGKAARNLATSIPAAVKKVVELGIADPDRIGVMGFSYGAYSTALLITRTNIFKAAIVRGGYYNAVSQYGQMSKDGAAAWTGILEQGHNIRGNPWTQRERYIENSPIFHLDRVQTPVLIISGSADTAARSSQAEELFVGLRRLGKEAEYVRYEGEEHYEARWSYANQLDYCQRMLAWFDQHLNSQR